MSGFHRGRKFKVRHYPAVIAERQAARVWCRLHLALQKGDLSVIWTHVSHLKRMTTEHITQALDQAAVEVARSFAGC